MSSLCTVTDGNKVLSRANLVFFFALQGDEIINVNKHPFQQMETLGELNHSKSRVCIFNKEDNYISRALSREVMDFPM